MFKNLQQKWKVGAMELMIILSAFAIGGSLTGFVGKKIMNVLSISQDWLWAIVYILVVTILWPIIVLLISIPLGQFSFFLKYIKKIGTRMGLVPKSKEVDPALKKLNIFSRESAGKLTGKKFEPGENVRVAIFASGKGSNAQKIIEYFRRNPFVNIELIVTDKRKAGVLDIAMAENIPTLIIDKNIFAEGHGYINELQEHKINFIVLAGFLRKIPTVLIQAYPGRIINLHPALLPKYGGKGMYGHFVHEAVIAARESESGISIHFVDEHYDHGQIIYQEICPVLQSDIPESLAKRIQMLEHEYYPKVIERLIERLRKQE